MVFLETVLEGEEKVCKDEYSLKYPAYYIVHQCNQASLLRPALRFCVFLGFFADVSSLGFCCSCEICLFHKFSRKCVDCMDPNLLIFLRLYKAWCEV